MRSFQKILILLSLTLIAVTAASAQDRNDRNDRDRNQQQGERWRVRHSGRTYDVDQNQAELLRQAVRQGYQQGYQAGRDSRTNRRHTSYRTMTTYREGTYGYSSGVDRSQYQYYFQQGFQKGYDDGYNSRYRYGRDEGGTVNIVSNFVDSILGLHRY
jgi:flagellar biosynthesis/type III secretory pathway protein FliH